MLLLLQSRGLLPIAFFCFGLVSKQQDSSSFSQAVSQLSKGLAGCKGEKVCTKGVSSNFPTNYHSAQQLRQLLSASNSVPVKPTPGHTLSQNPYVWKTLADGIVCKRLSLLQAMFLTPLSKVRRPYLCEFISESSVLWVYMIAFVLVVGFVTVALWYLKWSIMTPPALLFLLRTAWGLFCFHVSLKIVFPVLRTSLGFWWEVQLYLYIDFSPIAIFHNIPGEEWN